MIELGKILSGVYQRTTEGKLNWSRTVEKDRYVASIDETSIVILELVNYFGTTYRLDIVDEYGETIESLGSPDTNDEQERQLARLYVLARREALDIDATLEKLAKALEL